MTEEDLDYYDNINRILYKCIILGFFYPFQVLATNRMLNTVIQRKQLKTPRRFRMMSDFRDIRHLSRSNRALFLGLVPWTLTEVIREYGDAQLLDDTNEELLEIKNKVNESGEEDIEEIRLNIKPFEVWVAATCNLGAILSVRMQSVDYQYKRQLFKSIKYIVTKDFIKSLYKGFVPTYIGTWILLYGIQIAYQAKQANSILLKIVEETQKTEIAFQKPEKEVKPYGVDKV